MLLPRLSESQLVDCTKPVLQREYLSLKREQVALRGVFLFGLGITGVRSVIARIGS